MTYRSVAAAAIVASAVSGAVPAQNRTPALAQPSTEDALALPRATFPAVVALLNDPARALAALDRAVAAQKEAPLEAAVLRAHLLSDLHRYKESVAMWDDIARRDADLAAFAGRSAIADLVDAHDVDAVAPRIEAITGSRPRREHDLMLVRLAEACQTAGRPDRASEIYADVLAREREGALADRARLGLAASQEAAGQLDAALATFHQATISWRLADTFNTARADERRLASRSRLELTPLTADQHFVVAARLNAASRFDDAVGLLEEGIRTGRVPASDKAEAAIIEILYRGRHNDTAMARATHFVARFPGSRLAPSIRLLQLRLDIRVGNLREARTRLAALLADKRVPADARRSAQRLVAANLTANGSAREGLAAYRQLLRASLPRAERFDVYWRAGMAAIRAGEDRAAFELLRQARKYAPARSTPRSTLYWMAAASDRLGDAAEARRIWTQLVAENAYDYYGVRSADHLKAAGVRIAAPVPISFQLTQVTGEAAASPEFRTAMVLARAGLLDDAASMFRAAMVRVRGDEALALVAARACTAAGDYATAWSIVSTRFGEFLARPSTGMPEDVWQMAFPRAYWTEVEGAASRNGVDPLLLLSLMRRESRFVVAARSRTGALGLFQIMPYTAREILSAGQEASEADTPLNPPASADLAARLVKRIIAHFEGAPAPVVAAYNAGEDRVEDWWLASKGTTEDLFVDSIPYGETRQYVREVLANYATYKRLYTGSR